MNKLSDGFFTHIFFASETILLFGGLSLYRIYRLLKVNLNSLRGPTTEFAGKKIRRENPNSRNINWKTRKKPPKIPHQ